MEKVCLHPIAARWLGADRDSPHQQARCLQRRWWRAAIRAKWDVDLTWRALGAPGRATMDRALTLPTREPRFRRQSACVIVERSNSGCGPPPAHQNARMACALYSCRRSRSAGYGMLSPEAVFHPSRAACLDQKSAPPCPNRSIQPCRARHPWKGCAGRVTPRRQCAHQRIRIEPIEVLRPNRRTKDAMYEQMHRPNGEIAPAFHRSCRNLRYRPASLFNIGDDVELVIVELDRCGRDRGN